MNDVASPDAHIRLGMFEAACDILAAAVIVYDRNDCLVFASRQVLRYFPIPADMVKPGTRLRDVLGAIFDSGVRYGLAPDQRHRAVNREEWISAQISAHWREQYDAIERLGRERWIHFRKRRLPNGYNVTTLVDVSEQKKQEEQWRSDLVGPTSDSIRTGRLAAFHPGAPHDCCNRAAFPAACFIGMRRAQAAATRRRCALPCRRPCPPRRSQ